MTNLRSSGYARSLALTLIAAMYLLPAAGTSLLAAQAPVARQTLVVFPFTKNIDTAQPAQACPENLGPDFANSLKTSLMSAKNLVVIAYNERLASVARAAADPSGGVKKEDPAGPFGPDKDQKDRAMRLSTAMASDLCLVGSIDEYKYDAAKKQFQVSATAEMVDVRTGKTLKLAAVTGRSPEDSKTTDPDELGALAAGDAVAKIAAEIAPQATLVAAAPGHQGQTAVIEEPKKKKSWFKKLLVPIVLGVAVGVAASSGGHSSSSSSGGGPDLPPSL